MQLTLSMAIMQVTVSVAIMQLEVSATALPFRHNSSLKHPFQQPPFYTSVHSMLSLLQTLASQRSIH